MDKKAKLRMGLVFGVPMAVFFIVRDLWIADPLTDKKIIVSLIGGLVGGALAGFLFSWAMGALSASKYMRNAAQISLEDGENIILESPANHFKGIEGVGGKLYLTNRRLFFKSHKLNIQAHELSIPLSEIHEVKTGKSLGFVNNQLIIQTNQRAEKFVVMKLQEWKQQLQQYIPIKGTSIN